MPTLTNRQWRIAFGAINAACAFLLIQPEIKDVPVIAIVLGTVVAVLGFLRAPEDAPAEGGG